MADDRKNIEIVWKEDMSAINKGWVTTKQMVTQEDSEILQRCFKKNKKFELVSVREIEPEEEIDR